MSYPLPVLPQGTWRKYDYYHVHTDDKTVSFFVAFFSWFSFAPLMPVVRDDLSLSVAEEYDANIASVIATIAARVVTGPLCDAFGARKTFAILLLLGSIPTYLSGLVRSGIELAVVRFFVGGLGATFVCNQSWTSEMFAKEIVGIANATSAGWGNLGGGIAYLVMTSLWNGLKLVMSSESAWRVAFILPGTLAVMSSFALYYLADDIPKGNFDELITKGVVIRKTARFSMKKAYQNANSWILAIQYGACFGIEVVVFNVVGTYFHDKFDIGITKANLIAALFGFLNLFSRSLGGGFSDYWFKKKGGAYIGEHAIEYRGMRGRLWAHSACLLLEGLCILIFSRMNTLAGSVIALVFFSFGVQMSEGTLFGIVPYVLPDITGSVTGIVSAGGSMGAIIWSLIFRFGPTAPEETFLILGFTVLGTSLLTLFIFIPGHDSFLFYGTGVPSFVDAI